MLSPFPGMDPFLEAPSEWGGVHHWLISLMSEQLSNLVTPDFIVKIEERIYFILPQTHELMLIPASRPLEATKINTFPTISPAIVVERENKETFRLQYLTIRDSHKREVVTTIELLSPFNKARGTKGRRDFLRKRKQGLNSNSHWVEIDLLRAGERPAEVSNKSDYYALLKRQNSDFDFAVWYFDLRDVMPTIAVPLTPAYSDVPLDLQRAFNEMYRRAHYANSLDYSSPVPLPNLRPADTVWLKNQILAWQTHSHSN